MSQICPICGETAPEPASLCIPRLIRTAETGKPCDYSLEGEARFANDIGDEEAARRILAVIGSPAALAAEGKN